MNIYNENMIYYLCDKLFYGHFCPLVFSHPSLDVSALPSGETNETLNNNVIFPSGFQLPIFKN